MYNLKVENDLNLSHDLHNQKLNKLIRGSIKKKRGIFEDQASSSFFWDEKVFLLNFSSLFKQCNNEQQHQITKRCNDILMSDFYFLEKSGLAYCAKMILLGESTEIRQLYGLIASDEATHLEWFTPYVREDLRANPQGKLLPVLGRIIEDCDANTLYYLVQTIIEGWGVITYKALAQTCQNETFTKILKTVLRDEALHHQSGAVLFDIEKVNATSSSMIYDRLKAYTEVLRVGPQTVVQCIEEELGGLNSVQLELLFSELKTQMTSTLKLRLLKTLMLQPQMGSFIENLEQEGYFKAYGPKECARIYQETRSKTQFL